MREFPGIVSFTLTNKCNLKCLMCGQWGETGYMIEGHKKTGKEDLPVEHWKRVVDEVALHKGSEILLRGGEPFLYNGVMELLTHIKKKKVRVSIDTNGTLVKKYAKDLSALKIDHLTISIDGPEAVHERVRGVKGSFRKTAEAIRLVSGLNAVSTHKIGLCGTFTINAANYKSLGELPKVARELGLKTIVIVPYYYINKESGEEYEKIMQQKFDCRALSWRGFQRESSGVVPGEFVEQLKIFNENLGKVYAYPYFPLTKDDYVKWFSGSTTPAGSGRCRNIHGLLDIQPGGDVNFCVDFPDYIIGNIRKNSLKGLWNSERAAAFRALRDERPLPVCLRCGAKNMAPE